MAKIFYVVEKAGDYTQCNFFKTEKEALAYGIAEFPDFDMYDEPMEDVEDDAWFHGDKLDFQKGILFSFEEGSAYVQAMDEDEAREYSNDLGEEGATIFFDKFTKGMYGYLGNGADGEGWKWDWDGGSFNESKIQNTFKHKHVKLFEEFINEKRVNRSDLKELQDDYGYEAELDGDTIYVTGENPWEDDHEYTFSWDGENAYCGTDISDSEYTEPVTSANAFAQAISDTDNWE